METMAAPIKILHIGPDYQVMLFVKMDGSSIRSRVPLEKAVKMLKEEDFDLIVDEVHGRAILDPHKNRIDDWNPISLLHKAYPN
jgi:hypothetical protein